MTIQWLRQRVQYGFLSIGVICGALIFWAIWLSVTHPEMGIAWSFITGVVTFVSPESSNAVNISVGDRIITVDESDISEARFLPDRKAGEVVRFLMERRGEFFASSITLAQPSLTVLVYRLIPMVASSIFWIVGVGVFVFKSDELHGILFFVYCITDALTLAFGSVSAIAPLWSAQLFHIATWWSAVFGAHFHLFFPIRVDFKYKRVFLSLIYLLGILGTIADLAGGPDIDYIRPELYVLRRLWIVGSIILVILLLLLTYIKNRQNQIGQRIRLIVLSSSLCLTAFAVLTLLPDALFHQYVVPYSFSFIFLSIIPIAYAYSILEHRVIELDRYVNRTFVRFLNGLLLIAICLIFYAGIRHIFSTTSELIGILTLP